MTTTDLLPFALALVLGLLVGLQRERTGSAIGGLRTFPLVTLFGTLSGLLAQELGSGILAAGLIALAALIVVATWVSVRAGHLDPGLTTEVALLLMYAVGALLAFEHLAYAAILSGIIVLLLHLKGQLHAFAGRLSDDDVRAIMQFALLSLVILPIVPDRFYGPYSVLNPRQLWWMVVLIVGISLAAYVLLKLLGARLGSLVGGLLGGLISSTAATVTFARRARDSRRDADFAALAIVLAATVVFVRVLVEVAIVVPQELVTMAPPVLVLLVLLAALAALAYRRLKPGEQEPPTPDNPSELRTALVFGALYAAVLLAVAAARQSWGHEGMILVAILSGLTDMDAITLSVSQLTKSSRLEADLAWRLIIVASLSNLVFKSAMVAFLGNRRLLKEVALPFAATLAVGLALVWLWPA